jgi:predicted amidohydrolase YtcJ
MRALLLSATLLLGATLACSTRDPESADLILLNGRVYTFTWPDPELDGRPSGRAPVRDGEWRPDATAVAIKGDRIMWVGRDEGVMAWRGANTRVVNLDGATVLPGLHDAHGHVGEFGAALGKVDLTGVRSAADAIDRVRAVADTAAPGTWILGQGWDDALFERRPPPAGALTRAFPSHLVYLRSLHGFGGWANDTVLALAGIVAPTDSAPLDSAEVGVGRLPDGRPTGLVRNRAVARLDAVVPALSVNDAARNLRLALDSLARAGYTMVHDAGVDALHLAAYQQLAAQGRLPIRVYAMLSARDTALAREWTGRGPDTSTARFLTVRSVKAYYDGSLGVRGARLLADYTDSAGYRGVSGAGYGFDTAVVAGLMRAGFQASIHAIGDAGNREVLDFLESVMRRASATRSLRHRIEHAQVVSPPDVPRFTALQVVASMQPPHAIEDAPWVAERLGPTRVLGAYAWRTMRRAGVRLAFGSDFPGSGISPWYGLWAATTRRDTSAEGGEPFVPSEVVTVEEALRAYGPWAAWATFNERSGGTISAGRWADLTVLPRDPLLDGPTREWLAVGVRYTIVGGQIVHAAVGSAP